MLDPSSRANQNLKNVGTLTQQIVFFGYIKCDLQNMYFWVGPGPEDIEFASSQIWSPIFAILTVLDLDPKSRDQTDPQKGETMTIRNYSIHFPVSGQPARLQFEKC